MIFIVESEFLAHISEDGLREQTVLEHLTETADKAAEFAGSFGCAEEGRFAAMLHDIGKYSRAFQKRLLGGPRCDHSTAGAKVAWNRGDPFAAFAIAGHHGGLPAAGTSCDCAEAATLCGRCNRLLPDCSAYTREVTPPPSALPDWVQQHAQTHMGFRLCLYTRMLFSCLVDADFLNTEEFMSDGKIIRDGGAPLEALFPKFNAFLAEKGWDTPTKPLFEARWDILSACRAAGWQDRGFFTLTVPTGGGKTGASMAFALEHAKHNGQRRIIYVVPYTSIIEQNAAVFREMLGDENVLEHHCNVDFDPSGDGSADDGETGAALRRRLAAENWDAPVVVTTAVQFFESLFANKPSRCRKLHNMANSVIVLDEAQMLPVPYLAPCVAAITELVEHYGASCVLCTATQPALGDFLHEFAPALPVRELYSEHDKWQEVFRRVTFRQEGTLSDEQLSQRLNGELQVLCIVNTRKEARTLYKMLTGEGCYHLSTNMTPSHRRCILAQIRKRLADGLPCRVVSTSLVEAGVDVDFPTVYRAAAGLDSLLQAAGRCNREGKRAVEDSIVHIYTAEKPLPSIFKLNLAAAQKTLAAFSTPDAPGAITAYFKDLYRWTGTGTDQKRIVERSDGKTFDFPGIAADFRLIESDTMTVYIETDGSAADLAALRQGEIDRRLLRRLGQHAVNVYRRDFETLMEAGHLEPLCGNDRAAILRTGKLYDEHTGLLVDARLNDLFA